MYTCNPILSSPSQEGQIPLRPLILCALLFLILPNLLLLWGWFTPIVSIPLSILIIGMLLFLDAYIKKDNGYGYGFVINRVNVIKLLIAICLIACFVTTTGLFGGFKTHFDYRVFRHALFLNLANAPWPVILPNGKELSYYMSGILPLSILTRVFGAEYAPLIIYGFITFSLSFIYLLVSAYLKRVSLLFLLLGFFLCDITIGLGRFCPQVLFHLGNLLNCDFIPLIDSYYRFIISLMLAPLTECLGTYNANPYTMVACCIILLIPRAHLLLIPFVCALLCSMSPLGVIGLFPIAAYLYLKAWFKEKNWQRALAGLVVPVALAFFVAIYFLRADNPNLQMGALFYQLYPQYLGSHLPMMLLSLACFFVPLILLPQSNKVMLLVLAASLLIASNVFIGCFPITPNEIWMKGSIPATFILVVLITKQWSHLGYWRGLYLAVASISLLSFIYEKPKSFARTNTLEDQWNGHLNHDHPYLLVSAPYTKQPIVPAVMFRKEGESEECFPGNLLPKAPGIDYTVPAAKEMP